MLPPCLPSLIIIFFPSFFLLDSYFSLDFLMHLPDFPCFIIFFFNLPHTVNTTLCIFLLFFILSYWERREEWKESSSSTNRTINTYRQTNKKTVSPHLNLPKHTQHRNSTVKNVLYMQRGHWDWANDGLKIPTHTLVGSNKTPFT